MCIRDSIRTSAVARGNGDGRARAILGAECTCCGCDSASDAAPLLCAVAFGMVQINRSYVCICPACEDNVYICYESCEDNVEFRSFLCGDKRTKPKHPSLPPVSPRVN